MMAAHEVGGCSKLTDGAPLVASKDRAKHGNDNGTKVGAQNNQPVVRNTSEGIV